VVIVHASVAAGAAGWVGRACQGQVDGR